ncbi:membrane-bound transcription factor site-2 protease isoform X2 [Lingula anatina]|nr:membrane-bound transcription factor site-2 protease isoform X2 [Lingula anatina]|eukprot:XP_013407159.1 membrane-bound transcription factor site-2 protease isoform X2 [Lingula anatina]
MQPAGIAVILGTWSSVYLLDAFLKSNKSTARPYIEFLERTGISLSVGQIRWYTKCLNRVFLRMGQWKPRYLRTWFTAGVVFGMVAMLLSVCLLTLMVYNTLTRQHIEQQVLTPVMPGVNLPMNQIFYYLLTLLVCGILHEVGHAVAAVREQVRVNGFGIFILAVYPGAFVDLYTEHLQVISPIRQLRIYCAGVWHNFIIVIVALLVWFLLPWMLMLFYSSGTGVAITYVLQGSAVSGPRGLVTGDHVTSINHCRVTNVEDWMQCIGQSMKDPSSGYCMPVGEIGVQDVSYNQNYVTVMGNIECCNSTSSTHLCFLYHTKASPNKLKHACLPARSTSDRPPCRLQSDCRNPKVETACVYPSLDNSTTFLKVYRYGKAPLLFLGHPLDLHYSVHISNYVPVGVFIPLNMPYVIETFCQYLISLSGALAILNVVPCYALDGQWILLAFIEYTLRSTIPDSDIRGLIYSVIILFGTLLLTANIVIAMWTLFAT